MMIKKKSLIICMIFSIMLIPENTITTVSAANTREDNMELVMRSVPGLYKCVADDVNIRSGPGTNYDVVGTLNNGDLIYVTSISLGWARFTDSKGRIRYVSADYIEETRTSIK